MNSFSQSKESLQASTKKLYDSNYLMEFETLADLTYPKIFEEIDREAFIEKIDLDYQNEEYRLRLQLPNVIFQYSELKKSGGKSFYIVTFKNPVRYFFEEKLTTEQAAEKKKQLQEINQTQDVTFEPARNVLMSKKQQLMLPFLMKILQANGSFSTLMIKSSVIFLRNLLENCKVERKIRLTIS